MEPGTLSDRPSPRGGGHPVTGRTATDVARELIAESVPGMLTDEHAMAAWIGRATAVLRELTRDA